MPLRGLETYRRRWGGVTMEDVLIGGRLASVQVAAFGLRSHGYCRCSAWTDRRDRKGSVAT